MEKSKVIDFYDDFVVSQAKTQINERLYSLYLRLKKYGLNTNSSILELGSGIGAMTYLISKIVKKGAIETVEMSPKSVEYAKEHNKQANIRFFVDDVVSYKPTLKKIDYITLFDVIEHIPVDKHAELFSSISTYMTNDTLLLINIPNPEHIIYSEKYNPDSLQVIDQPIYMNELIGNLEKNNLNISFSEKYGIWLQDDYVFYAVKKNTTFEEIKLSDSRSFIEKVAKRILRIKMNILYNYK